MLQLIIVVLKWILTRKKLTRDQIDDLNRAHWYYHKMEDASVKLGCVFGGKPSDEDERWTIKRKR